MVKVLIEMNLKFNDWVFLMTSMEGRASWLPKMDFMASG